MLLELAGPDRGEGSLSERVRDRVKLHSLVGRKREELATQALAPVDQLAAAVAPQGAEGTLAAAVVDAALALSHGVDVFVLTGHEELGEEDRRSAELLAEELAARETTVIVVGRGSPVPASAAVSNGVPEPAPEPQHLEALPVNDPQRSTHE